MLNAMTTLPTHPSWAQRLALAACLLWLVLAAHPLWAADDAVQWSQGRLSVQVSPMALGTVLQHIQSRTGIVIKGDQDLAEPVRRGVKRLPLVQGLHQLLADRNHMIIEGQGRRPLRLIVISGAGSGPLSALAPTRAGATVSNELQTALASSDPAVRIDAIERLGDLADPANLAALQQALGDPAEAVRVVAQQALQARKLPAGRVTGPVQARRVP